MIQKTIPNSKKDWFEPLISCICPTYNRVQKESDGKYSCQIVEEAIESFLRQDYENKELIVVNDTPGQRLLLPDSDYSNVRVINLDKRFRTLGEKCNFGISQASGYYVTRWDDDDISLPNRLSSCVAKCQDKPNVLIATGYWWQCDGVYRPLPGDLGFQLDFFQRDLISKVKYRDISNGEDQAIRSDCVAAADPDKVAYFRTKTVDELFYIYRWCELTRRHLSDSRKDTEARYREIGALPIEKVDYDLMPYWADDYIAATRRGPRNAKHLCGAKGNGT